MNHKIELTTTEVLLINKALRLDMQNEVDNDMSELLIEKLNRKVKKDLTPTDLTDKCGSCRYAKPKPIGRGNSTIECVCPYKKPNFFARTNPKCKFYEVKK